MKRLILLSFASLLLSGCYTVVEFRIPSNESYASNYGYSGSEPTGFDSTYSGNAYRDGFQDGFSEYARFRDEQRWLRWNQWQYWGTFNDPLFWSYNDYYWDPSFYWSPYFAPRWSFNAGWGGPGWAGGFGGWGGWGNWYGWQSPVIVIQPGNGIASREVRGPRGSGRRDGMIIQAEAPRTGLSTPKSSLDPAVFTGGGRSGSGKSSGPIGGSSTRKPRSTENVESGNAVRGSSGSSGSSSRGSGRSEGGSSGGNKSGNSDSSSGSGRKPRGN